MPFRVARVPILAAAVVLCAAGTFVGLRETGTPAPTPSSTVVATPQTTPAIATAATSPASTPIASSDASIAAATATSPTPSAPQPQPALAKTGPTVVPAEPAASATPAATPATLPIYTSLEVLNRSRDVALPSGKAFADCVLIGAESGPWNFQVHDYWNLDGTWTVETHTGDVGLIFIEASQSFRVRNVNRTGC